MGTFPNMCDGSSEMNCLRSECFWCKPTGLCLNAGCATNTSSICHGTLEGYTGWYEETCGNQIPIQIMFWFTFVWCIVLFCLSIYLVWPFKVKWRVLTGVLTTLICFVCVVVLTIDRDIVRSLVIQLCASFLVVTPLATLRYGCRKKEKNPEEYYL